MYIIEELRLIYLKIVAEDTALYNNLCYDLYEEINHN